MLSNFDPYAMYLFNPVISPCIFVMDRDTNDVALICYVNRLNNSTGHSPILYT